MARERFGIEKGLEISVENSNTSVGWLVGTGSPDGLLDQAAATIGSIYQRINTGELYQKKTNVGDASDWVIFATGSTVTRWRPEVVDVITDDTQGAGVRDVVASPFSDDDGTPLAVSDFNVGNYIISDADGTPTLLEITAVASPNVTFAAATALVDGDAFITRHYLPDADGFENQALVVFSDGVMVKIADIDWNFATGINLSSGYSPQNGNPVAGSSVEAAIEFLDGNQDDLTTLSGVSQGSTDLGTFTGVTIPSGQNTKQAIQSLETAYEETDQNVDDLITLSGRPENSTDQGAMSGGDILTDNSTENALFLEIDGELTRQRGKSSATGITGGFTTVDSVLVDDVAAAAWQIHVQENGTPANKQAFEIFATHNGSADGVTDATAVDDNKSKILKLGSNFNVQVQVVLSGAGAGQVMQLQFNSTDTIDVYVKRIETLF